MPSRAVPCRAVPFHAMSNWYRKFGQSKTTWTYKYIVQPKHTHTHQPKKIIFTHDKTINLAKQRKCFRLDDAFTFAIKILAGFLFLRCSFGSFSVSHFTFLVLVRSLSRCCFPSALHNSALFMLVMLLSLGMIHIWLNTPLRRWTGKAILQIQLILPRF